MTLDEYLGTQEQACFCGESHTPLPPESLADHSIGCVVWDWAVHEKKQTPKARMLQLDHYGKQIGDPQWGSRP